MKAVKKEIVRSLNITGETAITHERNVFQGYVERDVTSSEETKKKDIYLSSIGGFAACENQGSRFQGKDIK